MDMNLPTKLPAADLASSERAADPVDGMESPLKAVSLQDGEETAAALPSGPAFGRMLESARQAAGHADAQEGVGGKGLPPATAQPNLLVPDTQLSAASNLGENVDETLQQVDAALPLPMLTAMNRLPEPASTSSRARPSLNLLQPGSQSSMPSMSSETLPAMQAEEQLQLDKLVRQGIDMLTSKDTEAPLPKSIPVVSTGASADSQLSGLLRPATTPLMSDTSATSTTQLTVNVEVGRSGWDQAVGRQLMWMAKQNIQTAELRLNPANLGPVEVRINIEDEQVRVAFSSPHAAVRDAVEQAVPRLKEMFDNSGLQLADTEVSSQSFAQQQDEGTDKAGPTRLSSGSAAEVTADEPSTTTAVVNSGAGLLDVYI